MFPSARAAEAATASDVSQGGGEEGDERGVVVVHVRAHGLHEAAEEEHGRLAVRGVRRLRRVSQRGQELAPGRLVRRRVPSHDVGGVHERAKLRAVVGAGERGEGPGPRRSLDVVTERAPVPVRGRGEEHRGEVARRRARQAVRDERRDERRHARRGVDIRLDRPLGIDAGVRRARMRVGDAG